MTDLLHQGLPVAGYVDQTAQSVALVNENKQLEERLLRQIDRLRKLGFYDGRMLALAMTGIQEACMWLNRSIFQPERVKLPEDEEEAPPVTAAPSTVRKAAAAKAVATRAARKATAGVKVAEPAQPEPKPRRRGKRD